MQLYEPKISARTISEQFGKGVLVFSGEILLVQKSSVYKGSGMGTTDLVLMEVRLLIKSLVLAFWKIYKPQKLNEIAFI